MIKKVLIVNRSEIALRVQQACRALGLKVVAIYAQEDIGAKFVHAADEAYKLTGHGSPAYRNQDEIIEIALKSGAYAIHPGYGFLSENANFASKVIQNGLTWIGPSPESMSLMGDKIQARTFAQSNGIPVIPGQFINLDDLNNLTKAQSVAFEIGYPIIIKDPLSGGGKGMRRVNKPEDFETAWATVTSEAKRMTGSKELLVEKCLEQGRHIEIQIAGDSSSAIHLFERECSIQRRHQKIIEETPCMFVPKSTIESMYKAAVRLAEAVKYKSVGTVEFMVVNDNFYFLEMNTRLQVEHSVTELTTGIDLVVLQIKIAQGEKIQQQKDILRRGHAIECRIYAENPSNNFLPSTGTITLLQNPTGPWIRHDHDLEEAQEITPFFDPMIAKITTYGPSRQIAIGYMLNALREYIIGGLITNISFLQQLLTTQMFTSGNFNTQSLSHPEFLSALVNNEISHKTDLIATELIKSIEQNAPPKNNSNDNRTINTNAWKRQQWR